MEKPTQTSSSTRQAPSSSVLFPSAEEATKGSICALARTGLESMTVSALHPEMCAWCVYPVNDLFGAAEAYVADPVNKIQLDLVDAVQASAKAQERQDSWGY